MDNNQQQNKLHREGVERIVQQMNAVNPPGIKSPLDFDEVDKLLAKHGVKPAQHHGVLSSLNQADKHPSKYRTQPIRAYGESEMRSGDLLQDDDGMFLPLRAVSKNPGGGLSINMEEMAAYSNTPKSEPTGHHRTNPSLEVDRHISSALDDTGNRAMFAEKPKSTWQKFKAKAAAAFCKVFGRFN